MIGRRDFFLSCRLYFFHTHATPLFLSSSSVSLAYLILAIPMREFLGKHSCMSFPICYIAMNGAFFFSLFGARETKPAQRTLLWELFLKWPFKQLITKNRFQLLLDVGRVALCRWLFNVFTDGVVREMNDMVLWKGCYCYVAAACNWWQLWGRLAFFHMMQHL